MTPRSVTSIVLLIALIACAAEDSGASPVTEGGEGAATAGDMEAVARFGANPGALDMFKYVPEGLPDGAPLVVVLHGCTQTASSMAAAGWNKLADMYKFAIVYAQQATGNNPVSCFNWAGEYGDPANLVRGQGENQSLASMVETMKTDHGSDSDRVYISGFSAGGAMAAVMLATWPEMFAAGAVHSGVPYRCAVSVNGATECQGMGNNPGRKKTPAEWGSLVREANPGYSGRLPRVSIWHGQADTFIVHHDNLVELTEQWTDVHGLSMTPDVTETVAGAAYAAFVSGDRTLVETTLVPGLGHAVSMGADDPEFPCALEGFAQYFSDAGICSTVRIANFFGLTGGANPDPGCQDSDCNNPTDGAAPNVNIVDPTGETMVAGTVMITADASDDVEVDRVEFYVDGQLQGTSRSEPFNFEWPTVAFGEGRHDLMAMAYDAAGNVAVDDDTSVEVDNDGDGRENSGFSGCQSAPGPGAPLAILLALIVSFAWRRRREV